MIKKLISLTAALALCLTLGVPAFAAESTTETPDKVQITFIADTHPQTIETFVNNNNISVDSFTVAADDTHTSGYVINEQSSFDSLWNDFVSMQTNLLSEGIANNKDSEACADMKIMLDALETNDFQMKIICDTPTSLTRSTDFVGSEIIESIQPVVEQTATQQTSAAVEPKASNWVPTSGHAGTWPSQNVSDATYMEVYYKWNSASELSTLTDKSDSTLEGDLVFYNYDDDSPATGWYGGNYTYNTNQPRPYQDTQAFDNSNEPVFCIGCSDASALKAKTDYYWIAYGNKTDSDGCKAKLNFQRGHRVIDDIYEETWNIFGDETKVVIPFSSWNTTTTETKYF